MKTQPKKDTMAPPDYILIPHKIVIDKRLNSADKFVYGAIELFLKMTEERCFASNDRIGEIVCLSGKAVSNSLLVLEKIGYIIRVFSDDSKRRRTEIISTIYEKRGSKKKASSVPSTGGSEPVEKAGKEIHAGVEQKELKEIHTVMEQIHAGMEHTSAIEIHTGMEQIHAGMERVPCGDGTSLSDAKEEVNLENTIDIYQLEVKSDPSRHGERNRGGVIERNIKEEYSRPRPLVEDHLVEKESEISSDHLGGKMQDSGASLAEDKKAREAATAEPTGFTARVGAMKRYASIKDVPSQEVVEGISLFLTVFPGEFMTKNPFAALPKRNAVAGVLMRLTLPELKAIVERYQELKTDRFRPEAGTIYDFCSVKFDRIEAFVGKSAGNLWAQKSIDTPDSERVRKEQYANKIFKSREKVRLAKEEWERNHPTN